MIPGFPDFLTGYGAALLFTGNVVLNGANTLALTLLTGTTPPGTYTLMTYAAKTGTGTLTLAGSYPNTTLTLGATSVVLTVATREATWKGNVNGTWDSITANWWVGGTPATYAPGDIVTFDDSAAGNFTVSGNASPSSVTVNNSANHYTLSGIIGGAGTPLLKSGTALLTLSAAEGSSSLAACFKATAHSPGPSAAWPPPPRGRYPGSPEVSPRRVAN